MKLYVHPRCTTCKKALDFLNERKLDYTIIDITQQPPSPAELSEMLGYLGGDVRKLFNTSGQQYRALGLKDKLSHMGDEEALQLLAGNGMLVKRPFVLTDNNGLVGFRLPAWQAVFS